MCGRYTQTRRAAELAALYEAVNELTEWEPRYNIAPSQSAPVIVQNSHRVLTLMRWGLIPFWAKEASIGNRMINARADTLLAKASFKKPFQRQRCLVVADSFYEWEKQPTRKTPRRFLLTSKEPFVMAGLWDRWRNPQGEEWRTFTIITTEANELIKPTHDRMPAILSAKNIPVWLDNTLTAMGRLTSLLRPYPASEMEHYRVSPVVNSPMHDAPDCIQPVSESGVLL